MLELIFYGAIAIFVLGIIFGVITALFHTGRGLFAILILPSVILLINFNFAWDDLSATYNFWFPNPLSPYGFIYDFFSNFCGGKLDNLLGVHFFAKAFGWLVGALDYVVLLTALHYLFYIFFLSDLDDYIRRDWIIFLFFVCWLVFFHVMFYMRKFADLGATALVMPEDPKNNFISYYWVSAVLSLLIVRHKIYSYRSNILDRIINWIEEKFWSFWPSDF